MNRRIYLYFIATILFGAVIGGTGTYYGLWYMGRIHHEGGFDKKHAEKHWKDVLNLSNAQMQQLDQILSESSQKTRALQQQMDPQFQAIHIETRQSIRQILNPDQQKTFDEHMKQIDERRKRHGLPPLPPP
jgi:Spy/CpxP family protein refolding chaperone